MAADLGDVIYDDPALLDAVRAAAASVVAVDGPGWLAEPGALALEFVRVVRTAEQERVGNITPLWNAAARAAVGAGFEYLWAVNDDLELVTAGWEHQLTAMLHARCHCRA